MNLPEILNVAIGLVVVYFLLSSIASLLLEMITTAVRYREEILYVTINRLLAGKPDEPWDIKRLALDRIARRLPKGAGPFGIWALLRGRLDQIFGFAENAAPAAATTTEVGSTSGTAAPPSSRDGQVSTPASGTTGDMNKIRRAKLPSDATENIQVVRRFWQHPKIDSLKTPEADAPPVIDAMTFAQVLIDVSVPRDAQGELPDNRLALDRALAAPNAETPTTLLATFRTLALSSEIPPGATGDALWGPFRANIARWFDEAAAQSTLYYKRTMQRLLLVVGLGLALLTNADTLRIVYVLSHDRSLSEATAAYATTLVAEVNAARAPQAAPAGEPAVSAPPAGAAAELQTTRRELAKEIDRLRELERIGFPIGWTGPDAGFHRGPEFIAWSERQQEKIWSGLAWLLALSGLAALKLVGVGATSLAVAQGAPFWYDLMQRLIGLKKGNAAEPPPAASPAAVAKSDGLSPASKVAPPSVLPLEIGYDLAAPATGFSPRKAYWLAAASAAAYSPNREIESLVKETWRFHRYEFIDDAKSGTQAFLAGDDKVIMVAFRGTEVTQLEDFFTDVQATFRPFGATGSRRVHNGFCRALDSVWERIETVLPTFMNPDGGAPIRQVFLTGHSLGGALATLMFARLTSDGARPVPTLYTYGCPMVGDEAFTAELDRAYPERIHRIVNNRDIVPSLPGLPDYHHAGRMLAFQPDGTYRTEISGLSRLLGHAAAAAATSLRKAAREMVDDHGITYYVKHCERLAKTA